MGRAVKVPGLRDHLSFEAAAPSPADAEVQGSDYDLDDDEVPPGRSLAAALLAGVKDRFRVREPLDTHSSYGWCFTLEEQGVRIWCMLQLPGYSVPVNGRVRWLVITQELRSFFARLLGREASPQHRAVCEALDRAVRGIAGVTEVRWQTHVAALAGDEDFGDHPTDDQPRPSG